MTKEPEKPDFICDQFGNVKDVRHLKYHATLPSPDNSSTGQTKGNKVQNFIDDIKNIPGSCLLFVLGSFLLIAGFALAIGNVTGLFPTFPYAGFLTTRWDPQLLLLL